MMKLRICVETDTAGDLSEPIAEHIRSHCCFDAEAKRFGVDPGRHRYDVVITGEPYNSVAGYDVLNTAAVEEALNRALLESGKAEDWRGDWGRSWQDIADLVLDVKEAVIEDGRLRQGMIEDFRLVGDGAADIGYVPLRGLVLQGAGLPVAADKVGADGRVSGIVLKNAWDDGLVDGIRAVYEGRCVGVPGFPPDEDVPDGFYVEREFVTA